MIMAVDFLPSVDYKYSVDKLVINETAESKDLKVITSSKSICGLRGARVLQSEVLFTGILGGIVGRYVKHHMDVDKIKTDIAWAEVETPHSITIVDQESNNTTRVYQPKEKAGKKVWRKAIQKAKLNAERVKTTILECRDLESVNYDLYGSLITRAKRYNVRTVVTVENKEILDSLVESAPYAMVFNLKQLGKMGFEVDDIEELTRQLLGYLDKGIHYIGVDLKERGGLLLSLSKLCYIEPLVEAKKDWDKDGVTGAFLGGIAVGIDRKYEQEKIGKISYALALAARENENYNKSHVDRLLNKVKIREMSKELYKKERGNICKTQEVIEKS